MRPLPDHLRPARVMIELPVDGRLIEHAHDELRRKAAADANSCYGYFPGMAGAAGVDSDLPACRSLLDSLPALPLAGRRFSCNFVRLSLAKQAGSFPFHLDSDTRSGFTGDPDSLARRVVLRLLVNLSAAHPRTLSFLNIDAASVRLEAKAGYVHYCGPVAPDAIERIVIPSRRERQAHAVLLCANRVMHTGEDDEHGHFVAGFGWEGASLAAVLPPPAAVDCSHQENDASGRSSCASTPFSHMPPSLEPR